MCCAELNDGGERMPASGAASEDAVERIGATRSSPDDGGTLGTVAADVKDLKGQMDEIMKGVQPGIPTLTPHLTECLVHTNATADGAPE